ncbi:M13 family metallopeptidase [Sphingomonas sp. PL-96]|uniref:M13-type metalloendopeptidase n=1 Tax=Sphingomonas sp. PL-96 TaxID=2887201 RepID=UPI001E291E18|nr:M13 family metallopeptidase [Sphingomonas sp. PL-96]MCC2976741.1 M13 family metallopeptidase [Sphingomonas sp. PL-96]
MLPVSISRAGERAEPGDDFYLYANAADLERMTIPPGRFDYGQFDRVTDKVNSELQLLIKTAARLSPSRGSSDALIGTTYAALLDEQAIVRRSSSYLSRALGRIRAANTHEAVATIMAHPRSSSLVAFNVFPAEGSWMLYVDQQNQTMPMLGLPTSAYLGTDEYSTKVREAHHACIAQIFALAGIPDGDRRAASIVALETEIARRQWSPERLRDRRANLHVMTVRELESFAPGMPWRTMLAARGVDDVSQVNLGEDSAIAAQAQLFRATPAKVWQDWLAFNWLRNGMDALPTAFRDTYWRFLVIVRGGTERPTRAADAVQFVKGRLPMELGRLYVERHFSQADRAAAGELLLYLKRAMAERLDEAEWMDTASRAEALEKLNAMTLKAGYPRTWPASLKGGLRLDDAAGNLDRLVEQDWERQRARLTDPAARIELWYQAPAAVNASYSVLLNAIEVPAAILQPPFFSASWNAAVNFGAIGAIIGHEMGHGFDDQGLLYDSKGVMRAWMSTEAQAAFRTRADRLVAQYDAFEPLPGVKLNGSRTIGENIGDLSGVSLAFRAYELYRKDKALPDDEQDAHRRFFLSWAKVWCYKAPESAIRYIAANSYHSPPAYRVNGVVRNIEAWYRAFDVRP